MHLETGQATHKLRDNISHSSIKNIKGDNISQPPNSIYLMGQIYQWDILFPEKFDNFDPWMSSFHKMNCT